MLLVLSLLSGGCSIVTDLIRGGEAAVFRTADYPVEITFPSGWRSVESEHPFDLQATNGSSYASVFVFHRIDLAHDQEPFELFRMQNGDILGRREMTELIAEKRERVVGDTRIVNELWSAERDGSKNYYYFSLVEFPEAEEYFLWVLFTAVPSYAERHLDEWDDILETAVLIRE